ncbi:NlpC/P60 family protein [Flavobacterium sp. LS1R47]|uniref:NlpC/P60 family protein n=1 Tax=Flavobacterium frigoritolerans TaxID=2987686 RepID=A0A9X3C0M5_9FLAO|nr:peptidoglycan endopeptidase [Flavobacterium frigoritolerans]MCV9931046.1 NlpC/P60 family protein [Flavobacterium frigoritolerans]
MKSFVLVLALFFFSFGVFSQEKYIKHKISKGENVSVIAKRYNVKVKDILDLNPKASKLLKLNSILLIPSSEKNVANKDKATKTKTKEKEVIASSKSNSNNSTTTTSNQETTTHEILAKETLYGISKQYQLTVDELKKANPKLESEGLKIGQQIIIPANAKPIIIAGSKSVETENVIVATPQPEIIEKAIETEIVREVLPKETKYAIAKEFGLTVAELEKQNPFIKKKLPVGSVLKIHPSSSYVKKDVQEEAKTSIDNTATAVATAVTKDTATTANVKFTHDSDLLNQLVLNATENVGVRYRSGGTTRSGFDCSGLMVTTFGSFDIKLPRSSIEQSRVGVKIASEEAKKGDLIFFKTNGRRQINHVGMVIEANDGEIKFIHSSVHRGVIVSSTKEAYYERNFTQVNRVLE